MAHDKKTRWVINNILREWYGKRRSDSEIVAYLPETQPLSELIDKVTQGLGAAEQLHVLDLKENWKAIVGQDVAKVSNPVSMDGGKLVVEVKRTMWLDQLRRKYKFDMIDKINCHCDSKVCSDILFVPLGRG
jgi:predicted nucleic acid-binding Zn ribbon protein